MSLASIEDLAGAADEALRSAILRSNQDPIPRSIQLKVFLIARAPEVYLQRVFREIELVAPLLARDRQVVQLLFAGASPALLQPALRGDLLQSLAQHFALAAGATSPPEFASLQQRTSQPPQHDLLGLGLGAVSRFGVTTTRNAADLARYYGALDAGRLPVISSVVEAEAS
jgi:coproporphyrinogen III oxidase-like Fe-S oxidoreductase